MLNVTFYGVRGSTPCCGPSVRRYGGSTSCVALEVAGQPPIVLDMGTGLRYFGESQPCDGTFRGTVLVSHLHWDHIQGLPFFVPVLRPGSELDIYAPAPVNGSSVRDAFDLFMREPYFPITVTDLPGAIRFIERPPGVMQIGEAEVLSGEIPHVGRTNGYRVTWEGTSVAYLSDHQQPHDGSFGIAESALELAQGADLLIHDAQYTRAEFEMKRTWGHCSYDYALWLAKEAGVKTLALFHHDPGRSDDALDEVLACARAFGDHAGFEVIAASEGLTLSFT